MWEYIFWAALTVILVVAEICTVQLVSVWFAAGGLAAFVLSLFGVPFYWQLIVFVVISTLLLIATRPLVRRLLKNKVRTNVDAVIDSECVVKEEINNIEARGRVLADGIDWAAKNIEGDDILEVGAKCIVKEVHGVTLFVQRL